MSNSQNPTRRAEQGQTISPLINENGCAIFDHTVNYVLSQK